MTTCQNCKQTFEFCQVRFGYSIDGDFTGVCPLCGYDSRPEPPIKANHQQVSIVYDEESDTWTGQSLTEPGAISQADSAETAYNNVLEILAEWEKLQLIPFKARPSDQDVANFVAMMELAGDDFCQRCFDFFYATTLR